MTTDVQDAQAVAAASKQAVDEAEDGIVSGRRSVSAATLHKIRDVWRHADLTADGARRRAEEERRERRLTGLAAIGEEVDKLAGPEHEARIADAVRGVAAACDRLRAVAYAHDADVAELVAAAADLGAEPAAPGGPRATSSYVSVRGDAISHKRVTVGPLGGRVRAALEHAMRGGTDRMLEVKAAVQVPEPRRPEHLLRNREGALFTMDGRLGDGMRAQLARGELTELGSRDIDLYMKGELA